MPQDEVLDHGARELQQGDLARIGDHRPERPRASRLDFTGLIWLASISPDQRLAAIGTPDDAFGGDDEPMMGNYYGPG